MTGTPTGRAPGGFISGRSRIHPAMPPSPHLQFCIRAQLQSCRLRIVFSNASVILKRRMLGATRTRVRGVSVAKDSASQIDGPHEIGCAIHDAVSSRHKWETTNLAQPRKSTTNGQRAFTTRAALVTQGCFSQITPVTPLPSVIVKIRSTPGSFTISFVPEGQ